MGRELMNVNLQQQKAKKSTGLSIYKPKSVQTSSFHSYLLK